MSNILSGNIDKAEKIINSVLNMAESVGDLNIQAALNFLIGNLYKKSSNFDKARMIYNDTIQCCSKYKLATEALMGW